MSDKPEWTVEDKQLHHTIFEHVVAGAYHQLLVALAEADQFPNDERFQEFVLRLEPIMDQIMDLSNDIADKIPGLISREEADAAAEEILRRIALLQGLDADTFLEEDRILQ